MEGLRFVRVPGMQGSERVYATLRQMSIMTVGCVCVCVGGGERTGGGGGGGGGAFFVRGDFTCPGLCFSWVFVC